ncbi:MAG: hypothetical protein ACOX4I_03585 [Anaerovoracaceae bacterium]|jgi:hypothetical protein
MAKVHIDFDRSANIKKRMKDNVESAALEWQSRPEHHVRYGTPVLGYVSADHPLFMTYFDHHVCSHPKEIWRPGNTVVLAAIPYSQETIDSNRGGDRPSQLWTDAFFDSMHLGMYLNRVIRDTLDEVGRIHSGTNSPTDWNEETHRPGWSHKLAAYAAGMGRFGIGGSFHTENGFCGRVTSILVDEHYAPFKEEDLEWQDNDHALQFAWLDSKYDRRPPNTIENEYGEKLDEISETFNVSREAIASCPGKAISSAGVNMEKCQAFCKTVNEYTPSPEVCGKCFFCDN